MCAVTLRWPALARHHNVARFVFQKSMQIRRPTSFFKFPRLPVFRFFFLPFFRSSFLRIAHGLWFTLPLNLPRKKDTCEECAGMCGHNVVFLHFCFVVLRDWTLRKHTKYRQQNHQHSSKKVPGYPFWCLWTSFGRLGAWMRKMFRRPELLGGPLRECCLLCVRILKHLDNYLVFFRLV